MEFKLIKKCYQDASAYKGDDCDFYLEESTWNDHDFYTTYCVHATRRLTGLDQNVYLGMMRIMHYNQTEYESNLLRKVYGDASFTSIPDDFVSVSFSIELFKGLNRFLTSEELRMSFVSALHLILGKDSEYYFEGLEGMKCFTDSLLRDSSMEAYELQYGKEMLCSGKIVYNLREQAVEIKLTHVDEPINLSFKCLPEDNNPILPNGMVAFIGKNGSGKSTAIYKLAKLIYADPSMRHMLANKIGSLSPNNMGVSKLFLVSYSPFDNFVLPGLNDKEMYNRLSNQQLKDSRFVFCGVRDLKKEMEEADIKQLFEEKFVRGVVDPKENDGLYDFYLDDRQRSTKLKNIDALAEEFADALTIVFFDGVKHEIWKSIVDESAVKLPSIYPVLASFGMLMGKAEIVDRFMLLSTGHKFFLHSMMMILAYIEANSLVLFDEPENHLHPPFLSFLLIQLRRLLFQYSSAILIATHSPVVLQENLAKNVFVVKRNRQFSTIDHPMTETFGASISTITNEVFDLNTNLTTYDDSIGYLYESMGLVEVKDIDIVLSKFRSVFGGNLSGHVESEVINIFAKYNDVDD